MPASKPTKLPRWATGATAQITEPNEGKKDLGHQVAEKPPAQYFNWLFNTIHSWLAWLGDFEAVAHTWTALQTFAAGAAVTGDAAVSGQATVGGGVQITGQTIITDNAGDTNASLELGGVITTRKLRLRLPGSVSTNKVRLYSLPGGGIEITGNCYWNGDAWQRDETDSAFKLRLSANGFEMFAAPADPFNPWADSAWLALLKHLDGRIAFTGVTTTEAGSNPPAATALANTLVAKNVCKAWAACEYRGDLTPKEFIVLDGFNVASLGGESGKFRLTFAAPMADTNYSVCITTGEFSDSSKAFVARVTARSQTYCDILVSEDSGIVIPAYPDGQLLSASKFDPVSAGTDPQRVRFDVAVFGKQTT